MAWSAYLDITAMAWRKDLEMRSFRISKRKQCEIIQMVSNKGFNRFTERN